MRPLPSGDMLIFREDQAASVFDCLSDRVDGRSDFVLLSRSSIWAGRGFNLQKLIERRAFLAGKVPAQPQRSSSNQP